MGSSQLPKVIKMFNFNCCILNNTLNIYFKKLLLKSCEKITYYALFKLTNKFGMINISSDSQNHRKSKSVVNNNYSVVNNNYSQY